MEVYGMVTKSWTAKNSIEFVYKVVDEQVSEITMTPALYIVALDKFGSYIVASM